MLSAALASETPEAAHRWTGAWADRAKPVLAKLPAPWDVRFCPVAAPRAAVEQVVIGGPIWRDPVKTRALQHCRENVPVTALPGALRGGAPHRAGPFVWGGSVVRHFGHQVAENASRVLHGIAACPDATLLLCAEPGYARKDVSGFVWGLLDWLGADAGKVEFVTRDFIADRLFAVPQAEQLPIPAASPAYLDLLDLNERRNALEPEPSDIVYVSRARMARRARGNHLGESYLCRLLEESGVRVIYPEAMPIRRQMEIYAGARDLVFAEGSAVHGRQLLGRKPQGVTILARNPGLVFAQEAMACRVARLCNPQAATGLLCPYHVNGFTRSNLGMAAYDLEVLFAAFAGLGIDIGSKWRADAYEAAAAEDLATWYRIRVAGDPETDHMRVVRTAGPILNRAGLGRLAGLLQENERPERPV